MQIDIRATLPALGLGLLFAATSAFSLPAPSANAVASDERCLSGFSLDSVQYRFVGSWSVSSTNYPEVTRHATAGEGPHYVELRVGESDWERHEVIESGEVFLLHDHTIWIDWNETGNVTFEAGGGQEARFAPCSPVDEPCDISGGISNATGWNLTGGCWGQAIINVETGVWHRTCNLDNDKECKMSMASETDEAVATFACGGEPQGQAGGNGDNTLWWNNACSLVEG